ncbi:prefoldin subunit alpha [Sulfolobus acidocaldarius SUSAZ]|nr:prefoldin subunit alpha [Sulfolobus acidocaldarius SUSAZ]
MSEEAEQQQAAEYIAYLYDQATALRQYIDTLQKNLAEVLESLEAVRASKSAVDEIGKENQEYLLFGDRKGNIVFKVNSVDKNKVLIHLGLNYYAEVDPQAAKKILDDREQQLAEVSKNIQGELSKSIDAYNQIAEILSQVQGKKGE